MKFFILLVLLTTFLTFKAYADSAVGVVIGDPTGVSGRLGLDGKHSLEGALAYSSGHYDGLHIHATYLWDRARTFAVQRGGPIETYYGLGVRLINFNKGEHDGELAIGPRAPLGLLYNIDNPDIEIFGEVSLAVDLMPETNVDLDLGIGVRLRF
ncbi:hypothetical protein AZI85_15960 [Bdellovibrio bacteriovorus]|uniref:Outer membrane protein beta-barrel domain-containing protein n=2 Tax=Bdellovibrio bacteriovorus TaxID=959 RepID=A0A150WTQ9_BDEBC|nr:hypothetical protein AZI85_15960 [Bdellovibrio bacteriovorus]